LEKEADLNDELKSQLKNLNVKTPIDFAVKINGKRKELSLEEFPSTYGIYDVGQKTIKKYVGEIKKAKSIYMKGPAGDFSSKGFEKGTYSILKAIVKSKAFSLIGGGHLSDAIDKSGISKKKFGHISLSGGALLKYLAGEKLPGLEALK
ncbi:MAG: phosphoglycerate kinase, partial [Nanoarchaeota archaeon]|nr:phosphoglycerate kinase [Nanoarchaeota archaeon]